MNTQGRKRSHSAAFWGEGRPSDGGACWMKRCRVSALHSLKAAHRPEAPLKHVTVRNVNLWDATCMLVWQHVITVILHRRLEHGWHYITIIIRITFEPQSCGQLCGLQARTFNFKIKELQNNLGSGFCTRAIMFNFYKWNISRLNLQRQKVGSICISIKMQICPLMTHVNVTNTNLSCCRCFFFVHVWNMLHHEHLLL